MGLQRLALISALLAALTGCAAQPEPPAEAHYDLDAGKGAITFVLERQEGLRAVPFILTLRRYDPATNAFYTDDARAAPIEIRYALTSQNGKPDRHWTVDLAPGAYAIESIEIAKQYPAVPGAGFVVLGLTAMVGAVAAELDHKEIRFDTDDNRLTADAPRFRVETGTITYIGDFRFLLDEKRFVQNTGSPSGPDAYDEGTKDQPTIDRRIFVDYQLNTAGIRRYARAHGLDRYPMAVTSLDAFADRRFVIRDFDTAEGPHRTLARAPSMTPAPSDGRRILAQTPLLRPAIASDQPAITAPIGDRQPASASPPPMARSLSVLSDRQLQRLFLDGQISPEEYRAARQLRN